MIKRSIAGMLFVIYSLSSAASTIECSSDNYSFSMDTTTLKANLSFGSADMEEMNCVEHTKAWTCRSAKWPELQFRGHDVSITIASGCTSTSYLVGDISEYNGRSISAPKPLHCKYVLDNVGEN